MHAWRAAAGAAAVMLACLSGERARGDDPTKRGFDADPSRPALSLDGNLTVETAAVAKAGTRGGALILDYTKGLLALRLGGETAQVIESRFSAHLLAGYAFERAEVAVHLPLVLAQRSDLSFLRDRGVTGPLVDDIATTALGDLRLFGKLALLREPKAPLGLAALLDVRLPTGDPKAFTSDGTSAVPGLVATRTLGRFRLDAQLGYVIREEGQYAQLVVHDGFTGGVGASLTLPGVGPFERTRLMGELLGGWPRGYDPGSDRYKAPLSTRGGVRAWLPACWSVEAGAGTGLGETGYGRESWRAFAGVRWTCAREEPADTREPPTPEPTPPAPLTSGASPDRDDDGVPNDRDVCPDVPGSPEMDGCPDRDSDFIPDPEDRCPDEPGPAQNEGCPVRGPVVELTTERLSLKDAIHFDTDRATIKPESSPVLDAIAAVIRDHPELRRVRVEGHTDNTGSAVYNRDLSLRRARSVVQALVQRGISADRLAYQGFGLDRPVADNRTALGRAKNRRVEFTILEEKP
jgi:outer membrane protein OmpA-like peptidoglycan-associated protein